MKYDAHFFRTFHNSGDIELIHFSQISLFVSVLLFLNVIFNLYSVGIYRLQCCGLYYYMSFGVPSVPKSHITFHLHFVSCLLSLYHSLFHPQRSSRLKVVLVFLSSILSFPSEVKVYTNSSGLLLAVLITYAISLLLF